MPFLIPAVSAAVCDVAIIYLSTQQQHAAVDESEDGLRAVFRIRYILPLAMIRLFLLLIPLPYHSYTGTAVKCPYLYQLLYGATLLVISVHMLALIMMDPASLSSLLPSPRVRSLHELATRHIWLLLTLSLVSNLCHLILFFHVRSTAPANAEIRQGRPKVLFYYVKEREDNERDSLLQTATASAVPPPQGGRETLDEPPRLVRQNSTDSMNPMQRMTNEFMLEIQSRMKKTKTEWTKLLDDYRVGSGGGGAGGSQDLLHHRPLTPFRVLLQLFAYEEVIKNGRLDAVYDQDDGEALMFFVPQLLSFLLHGAYESSPRLEEWVLDTCRKNVYFAHKCYWFLRAWCLEIHETTVESYPQKRLSRPNSFSSFDGLSSGEPGSPSIGVGNGNSNIGNYKGQGKFLPEERAVLEQLLVRVMECGEDPARFLQFGSGHESETSTSSSCQTTTNTETFDSSCCSPSALMMATESGAIPVDPQTGMPSPKHWDSVAAPRTFGFLPLDRALTNNNPQQQRRRRNDASNAESYFDAAPLFLDALLTMADNLFLVPREQRAQELTFQLKKLEVQALPSNAIYIPLQSVNHRVWRIVADESIAINTKERVPCIICLEVVEYNTQQDLEEAAPPTRDVRRLLGRAAAKNEPNIMMPDLKKNVVKPDLKNAMKEKELVHRWRYGHRDPHRRDTALEKLAYSMRDGIRKIQLEQMKTSVQAQFDKLRDTKSNLKDFWPLNVPETFDDEVLSVDSPELHTLTSLSGTDIERGDEKCEEKGEPAGSASKAKPDMSSSSRPIPLPTSVPATPPRSPVVGKNSTMGQWSSPHHPNDSPLAGLAAAEDEEDLNIPSRMDRSAFYRMDSSASDTYPEYGSNGSISLTSGTGSSSRTPGNGRRNGQKKTNGQSTSTKPPTHSKPPPVVFKENWKQKEDRLRSQSAYGNHPGWRLLPILLKANDDLRQEQLASQLIYRISLILARECVPVWLCPYEILAITESGGIIEAIPDTISIASLKKNDPNFTGLKGFFHSYFEEGDDLADAKANFCESLAAYSIVCFLLQIKDRHNGNILLDNRGHLIHIDFGFFFLSSPGKNTGFESAPFKLTRDFVELMDGPDSRMFRTFRLLCYRAFIALRRHCMEIILLIEMLKKGNEDLACFRGRPDDAIQELRDRFRLDLNDRACLEYVNALIDDSLENWRTNWYDRYQRYCVGVL